MSKPSVLITAIGGDIGQSIARALGIERYHLVTTDLREVLLPKGLAHRFYRIVSAADPQKYLKAIAQLVKKEKIEYFIPVSEPEIKLLDCHRRDLELFGVKTLINNPKIIEHFSDKLKTAEYLARLGVHVPKTFLLKKYDGRLGFPMVVKARFSCGSKQNWLVVSPEDLVYVQTKDDGTFIAQEYLGSSDEEYTTGIFSDGKNISSISFRRTLGPGGTSFDVTFVKVPQVEKMAERIANDVQLVGCINLQSRKVGKDFVPFEINPRLSSTVLFRKKFGFDDCRWWMDALTGKEHRFLNEFSGGRGIRYLTEAYFGLKKRS